MLFRRKRGTLRIRGLLWQLPLATAGHNWLTRLQQGRCGASLVSLPYSAPKTAHRATQGQVWFWLAGWRFSGGSPPFRQSRIRTQAEEKIPLPHFSEMEPVKSVIPCKRFFKPSGVKAFSLFMRRRFCAARGGPHDICSTVFSHTNSEPGLSWAGFKAITSIFGGDGSPHPVLLQSVRHGLVDRPYRVQEHTVFYFAVSPLDGGLLCVDESLLLQPVHVLPHRVGAHPCALADSLKAGPALIRLPVLAE